MIKVSVLYPNTAGSRFDLTYYLRTHVPLTRQKLGAALRGVSVEHGVSGLQPASPPPYHVMGHMLFDSVEAFRNAFEPNAEAIVGDIANYTDTTPTIQISDVKLS
jgi:uncharacterized protein (TIGR02118 family)